MRTRTLTQGYFSGGWICEVTSRVFESMGVRAVAKTRANFTQASADLYPSLVSSYTRCVYEIVAGNVDICVAGARAQCVDVDLVVF